MRADLCGSALVLFVYIIRRLFSLWYHIVAISLKHVKMG